MTFSCCNIVSRQWWSNLIRFMNENLFMLNFLKFDHIMCDTTTSMHQKVPCTRKKNKIDILSWWLIACCKLASTLTRQMWRHNYVIGRNEYLISTLSESTISWVYSLQFLFKSTHNSWRYERKCEWVFFFWTQCSYSRWDCRNILFLMEYFTISSLMCHLGFSYAGP